MDMITIGVDFHKRTSSFRVLDEKGITISKCKLENDPDVVKDFLDSIPGPKRLGMEACRSWSLFYDTYKECIDEFHLGHPKKMRAITTSETKNDQNDAYMTAKLTHSGFLPEAHVSSPVIRELRSIVRFRSSLVNQRRIIRNQIYALVDRNIWPCHVPKSFKNMFCKRGRMWLGQVQIPERERFILDQCLKNLDRVNENIVEVEKYIRSQECEMQGLEYLKTVPGFRKSIVSAYCVLVETSDIARFKNAKSYAHYAGLVPREYSSGDNHRTGRLVKGANMHLRTSIIESTLAAIRTDKGLRRYYLSKKEASGSGDAIIATARKLSYAIYHVFKEKRAYIPEELKTPVAACHSYSTCESK